MINGPITPQGLSGDGFPMGWAGPGPGIRAPSPSGPPPAGNPGMAVPRDQAAVGRGSSALPADMHIARSGSANAAWSRQPFLSMPRQRVLICPNRLFTMRKGCSALERTDAFPGSMPFSAESAQSRPFAVEGFLATVCRIDGRCGPEAASGRFAAPVHPEPAWQDRSSPRTGEWAMATPDTLAAAVSTACTRPLPASGPMCALKPKCQLFPFLPGGPRGRGNAPRSWWSPAPR